MIPPFTHPAAGGMREWGERWAFALATKLLHLRPKAMGVEQQSAVFETGRNFWFVTLAAGDGNRSEYAVGIPAASALPLAN